VVGTVPPQVEATEYCEVRYEITPAELIAAIRAHGAELPGENHADAADRD